jgi:hypothetical protein
LGGRREPLSLEETAACNNPPALCQTFVDLCRQPVSHYLDRCGHTSRIRGVGMLRYKHVAAAMECRICCAGQSHVGQHAFKLHAGTLCCAVPCRAVM